MTSVLFRVAERSPASRYKTDGRPDLAGWATGTILFIVLAVVLPLLVTKLSWASFRQPAVGLGALITTYAAGRLVQLVARGSERLLQITFWVFVYIWFGLAATAEIVQDTFPIPFQNFDRSDQVTALTGIVIGLVGYDLGVFARNRSRGRPWLQRTCDRYEIVPRRVWVVAGVGILATLYFTAKTGLATRFSSRDQATAALLGRPAAGLRVDQIQNKASGLIQASLLWMPAFLGLFLLLYLYRQAKHNPPGLASRRFVGSLGARRLIVVLFVINILANNPLSNPRYRFGGVALAWALAVVSLRTRRRLRVAVLALLVGLLFVFPYAAVFRYQTRVLNFVPLKTELVDSPDYGMFQQELNGVEYIRESGHTFGEQTLGAVFSFVPRKLWTSKPIDTGNLISRTELINASATLWTEANVEFGWPGIFIFFLAYGWVSAAFDKGYVRRRAGPTVIGAAVPLWAAFQVFILRGSLQPVVGELAPVAVVFCLCLRRRRESPALAPANPVAAGRSVSPNASRPARNVPTAAV